MIERNNSEYGYELAYRLAREQLAEFDDIEQQCLRSGAKYMEIGAQKVIMVEYLNQSYRISLPDIDITLVNSEERVPLKEKILILHYLTQAKNIPASNITITYKDLPEGLNYFPTFSKRAIEPIVGHFGKHPHLLIDNAEKLGGQKTDYGDVSITINAFSRVPITFVLWKGDEEFPPEGSILFDSTISDHLSTEDINVLCEAIAWKLVRLLKTGGDNHSRN